MRYRAIVDKSSCIGSGRCVGHAPLAFGFDENDTSEVLTTIAEVPDERILQAAKLCPVTAITVYDEEGVELYPQGQ